MAIRDILQDRRKLLIFGGIAVIVIAAIIILLFVLQAKQTPKTDFTKAITNVVLAKGITSDKKPVNITDVFALEDPEIYAFVTLSNLPAQSVINYQWYDLKTGKTLKPDDPRTAGATFSGVSSASLIRAIEGDKKLNWGVGKYELRVSINGQVIIRKPYSVKTSQDIEQNNILTSIQSIQLTSAIDLQGKPAKNVSNIFSKDDENIYASITYENMPKNISFEGRWTYKDGAQLVDKYQKNIVGSGVFAFGINSKNSALIPTKKWPTGKYKLDIYLDTELLTTIDFEVN